MNDTIYRQAAIDAIESHIRTAEEPYYLHDTDKIMNHAFEVAASCVYNLPSAQPERKKGRWNWVGFNIECSECGAMPNFDSTEPLYNYCPNCGADMRGDT